MYAKATRLRSSSTSRTSSTQTSSCSAAEALTGTGKTRTLTHRVGYLLASGRAAPRQILAVTFSVRAAGELRLRLADLLGEQTARGVSAATFHSVCARLLREHGGAFGRTDSYTIYDQADLRHVIEHVLSDRPRDEITQALERCGRPSATELEHEISVAKNRLLSPEAFDGPLAPAAGPLIAAVWRACDRELERCTPGRSTTCSCSRCGCCASSRSASRTCAHAGAGSSSTSWRTPTRRRRRCSNCWLGRPGT